MDNVFVAWESTCYPDGGKYEGLMRDGVAHGRGIYLYPTGVQRLENRCVAMRKAVFNSATVLSILRC